MSATYSTNLALELVGTGDQAGNWGATNNLNLGTLIEQAISGYIAYSCSGGAETLSMPQWEQSALRPKLLNRGSFLQRLQKTQ